MSERLNKNAAKRPSNNSTLRPSVKINTKTGSSAIVASQTSSTIPDAKPKKSTKTTIANEPKIAATKSSTSKLKLKPSKSVVTTVHKTSIKHTKTTAVYDPQHKSNVVTSRSQKNVMNTIHNVTVISPSSTPRTSKTSAVIPRNIHEALQMANLSPVKHRDRTQTHTLEPDEVLVLNRDHPKVMPPAAIAPEIHAMPPHVHKDPIAFDIILSDAIEPAKSAATTDRKTSAASSAGSADDDSYEDDFESYESDFESCSSSGSAEDNTQSESTLNENTVDGIEEASTATGIKSLGLNGSDVDSGMYELKMRNSDLRVEQLQVDSGQPDSGFGRSTSSPIPKATVHAPESVHRRRVQQLLAKLTLDTMSYALFEMRPVPYAQYMRMFGHRNGTQMHTQTPHRGSDQDAQTDSVPVATAWTQHPVHVGRTAPQAHEHRLGCGRVDDATAERHAISADDEDAPDSWANFDASLQGLASFGSDGAGEHSAGDSTYKMPIDLSRLSGFLQRSEWTIAAVCSLSNAPSRLMAAESPAATAVPGSRECRPLRHTGWDDTVSGYRVGQIVGDERANVVFGVHAAEDRPYACTLVSVWKLSAALDRPMYVLRSWSPVTCLAVDERRDGLIYGGLADGCIAIWNVMQPTDRADHTHSPCQLIGPQMPTIQPALAHDIGAVIAIRTSPLCSPNTSDQIYTLHEHGLLTAWTVVPNAGAGNHQLTNDPSSAISLNQQLAAGSLCKLVQSGALDLATVHTHGDSAHAARQMSGFQRTLSLFESNLFNDAALQELQAPDSPTPVGQLLPALRCSDLLVMATGALLVATNRAYLLHCTASLHSDTVLSIRIADHRQQPCTFATRLAAIGDRRSVIAVGLNDGSVQIVCDWQAPVENDGCTVAGGGATSPDEALKLERVLAKSCTIQSMIEEERPVRDRQSRQSSAVGGLRDTSGDPASDVSGDALRPLRLRSRLALLHGLALNDGAVRWMAHAARTNCLLVLGDGGGLRRFDVAEMRLVAVDEGLGRAAGRVVSCGLCCDGGDVDGDKLAVMTIDGDFQVHTL